MTLYVIADLHLQSSVIDLQTAFVNFVAKLESGSKLVIIGDLFNFFVGLDPQDYSQELIRSTLEQAQVRGISAYFVHGNRDFLVNETEASKLGFTLLPPICLAACGNKRMLLSHGDLFCTNNLAYLNYHKRVNNKKLQAIFRCLPLSIRRAIAVKIRAQSALNHAHYVDEAIYGVVEDSVQDYCCKYLHAEAKLILDSATQQTPNVDQGLDLCAVVHGHIHKFMQTTLVKNSALIDAELTKSTKSTKSSTAYEKNTYERYVLGAWGEFYSFLKWDGESIIFAQRPLRELLVSH